MTVFAPLSTTTWPHAVAAALAAVRRASSSADRSPSPSALDARAGTQPRELAGMGRQHARPEGARSTTRRASPSSAAPRRRGPAAAARARRRGPRGACARARSSRGPGRRPGPSDDRVVIVVEDPGDRRLRVDLLDVVLGQGHRRRLDDLRREQRLERLGNGERDEPGAGPTRGPADEQRRARVVERAGDRRGPCRTCPCGRAAAAPAAAPRRPGRPSSGRRMRRRPRPSACASCRPKPSGRSLSHRRPARPPPRPGLRRDSARSRSIRARMRRSRSSSRSSMSSGKTYRPPAVRIPNAIATAYSASWLIDTAMRSMPSCSARRSARPWSRTEGWPVGRRWISISVQPMPRTPSPSTLLTASLAAHRPAKFSGRSRT